LYRSVQDAADVGLIDEISPVYCPGAPEHLFDVLSDRVPAQVEFVTDLAIGQAAGDQREDG
jgi:hypothetical protein